MESTPADPQVNVKGTRGPQQFLVLGFDVGDGAGVATGFAFVLLVFCLLVGVVLHQQVAAELEERSPQAGVLRIGFGRCHGPFDLPFKPFSQSIDVICHAAI